MCIICLEFNKRKDFVDAERMIEAARREANAISETHLMKVQKALGELKDKGDSSQLPRELQESDD